MRKIFTLLCCMLFAAQYSSLKAQTATMKIWKDGSVAASYSSTDVDSVTFETNDMEYLGDGVYLYHGHKFIDLDLPSGILWAETNIGAETAADEGIFFAWGETDMTQKTSYGWDTYKYGSSSSELTKYNSTDGKTVLDDEDDAAHVNWGVPCRMPTAEEFEELRNSDNCTWSWTSRVTSSGTTIKGYRITSNANGNVIFLPAAGYYLNDKYSYLNTNGYYWTNSLKTVNYANYLYFYNSGRDVDNFYRYGGRSIRPVAEAIDLE